MKLLLLGSYLFLLYITVVVTEGFNSSTKITYSKEAEKLSYPKKVKSIKKNILKTSLKKIADITEKFRDLPADDLAFIKELDKQFKLHGGKVKIKVENNNVTESKNSKRTIDGELGYGYAHNGYQYNPPKFMFYPYSQQNIDSNAPKYYLTGDGKSQVSIEPSYSYELKSKPYITHSEPQIDVPKATLPQHSEDFPVQTQVVHKQQQYEEPVIVLRIPGPAKYATHLRMLLQKYLEIRAAQYLHILEESQQRNNQLQQLDYEHGNYAVPHGPIQHVEQQQQNIPIAGQYDYAQQQVHYSHQNVMAPQPELEQYPEIYNVYHSYKNRYSAKQGHTQQLPPDMQRYYAAQQSEGEQHNIPQYEHQPQHQQQESFPYQQRVQEHPQFYYTHEQQYAQPVGPPANTYHEVYLVTMVPQGQADYGASQAQPEKQQPTYVQNEPSENEHSSTLPIAENNPRPSHTKVIFTNKNQHTAHDYQMYRLPSINPNERHAPTSIPDYHQDFQQQQFQNLQGKYPPAHYQQDYNNAPDTTNPEVVAITQRPYNYHAHSVKAATRGRIAYSRRATTTKANNGLQKTHEFVHDKSGADTGSAV